MPRRTRLAMKRLGENHLDVADIVFFEGPFAVAEGEFPHANERFVKSQSSHIIDPVEEGISPPSQGLGVVRRNIREMDNTQIGLSGCRLTKDRDRDQTTARKDIPLDKVNGPNMLGVVLVGNCDGLQCHQAVRFEKPAAVVHEFSEVLMTDFIF